MGTRSGALLISPDESVLRSLQWALEGLGIGSVVARRYEEARFILEGTNSPELVLCDTSVPDMLWAEVIKMASQAGKPIPVIVVSQVVDYLRYRCLLEAGAADILVPPFLSLNISCVIDKFRVKLVSEVGEQRLRRAPSAV